jgi:hypothetical protein
VVAIRSIPASPGGSSGRGGIVGALAGPPVSLMGQSIRRERTDNSLAGPVDEVGIRGRRSLVKRLFFDNLDPTLLA